MSVDDLDAELQEVLGAPVDDIPLSDLEAIQYYGEIDVFNRGWHLPSALKAFVYRDDHITVVNLGDDREAWALVFSCLKDWPAIHRAEHTFGVPHNTFMDEVRDQLRADPDLDCVLVEISALVREPWFEFLTNLIITFLVKVPAPESPYAEYDVECDVLRIVFPSRSITEDLFPYPMSTVRTETYTLPMGVEDLPSLFKGVIEFRITDLKHLYARVLGSL